MLAQSAMRKEVGNLTLDELFLERERLNAGIALQLDDATQPWGIRVFRYEPGPAKSVKFLVLRIS